MEQSNDEYQSELYAVNLCIVLLWSVSFVANCWGEFWMDSTLLVYKHTNDTHIAPTPDQVNRCKGTNMSKSEN